MNMAIEIATASPVSSTRARPDFVSEGALLGRATVVIWNDVSPEGVGRFYEWHDKEHVPERLALPGFRRGRRFRCVGHSPEWLTLYEAEDVSALVSPEYLARLNAPTPATTEALRHFRNTSRAVCTLVHSVGTSTGGYCLALRMSVEPRRSADMAVFLRDVAFEAALVETGVLACHLLAADSSASFVDTAESKTRTFDVPAWVVLCEASSLDAAQAGWRAIDTAALRSRGVVVRPDAAAYALEICRLSKAGG